MGGLGVILRNRRGGRPMPGPMSNTTAPSNPAFLPARAKLWIASIDDPKLEVRAQYNPKELQIDKQVPWMEHKAKDNRSGSKRTEQNPSQQFDLEFNGAPTRSMTLELLFDCYEGPAPSVEPDIQTLEVLSSVQDPEGGEQELRRPHHCIVVWGASSAGMPPFPCVIESLTTKYTMWDHAGTPKRATCTVKLKEAHRMSRSGGPEERTFGEKRRGPGWSRGTTAEYDAMSEHEYMARLAWEMNRPAPSPAPPPAPSGRRR